MVGKCLPEAKLASVEMLLLLHTKGDDWDAGEETCSGAADVGARVCVCGAAAEHLELERRYRTRTLCEISQQSKARAGRAERPAGTCKGTGPSGATY